MNRRIFVLGGHITPFIGKKHPNFVWKRHPDFGKRENPALEDYIDAAVNGAFNATGVPAAAIEKAWIGNFVGAGEVCHKSQALNIAGFTQLPVNFVELIFRQTQTVHTGIQL